MAIAQLIADSHLVAGPEVVGMIALGTAWLAAALWPGVRRDGGQPTRTTVYADELPLWWDGAYLHVGLTTTTRPAPLCALDLYGVEPPAEIPERFRDGLGRARFSGRFLDLHAARPVQQATYDPRADGRALPPGVPDGARPCPDCVDLALAAGIEARP